ncbi:MAG: polar amino acid transport system substrate-binding protein [Gammaproteobacteria bacterium]|jgi:polar amino acid transport system substrate-binding protein
MIERKKSDLHVFDTSFCAKPHQKMSIFQFLQIFLLGFLMSNPAVAEQDLADPSQVIQAIQNLNWITEEYPPFNYRDPSTGEITGASVEVLMQIFAKLGIKSDSINLKLYPWARGYHKVLNDAGTALFSTTYTLQRLQDMKFLGPIAPNVIAVTARKSRQLKIESVEDLDQLKISVVRDDIGEQLLLGQGVKPESIDSLNTGLSMVKKLASGRVDAVAYTFVTTLSLFERAKINPDDFEIIYILKQSNMGYAFHNDTDARILEPMRKALDELIIDGTRGKILSKYSLKSPND